MHFIVASNQAGNYSWWLYSSSDMVAWSGESFDSKANAERAALAFKIGAKTARYDIYLDTAAAWRWRAWRSSDKVAASGENFSSKANAERAAESVRDNAVYATGP